MRQSEREMGEIGRKREKRGEESAEREIGKRNESRCERRVGEREG